VRSACKYCYNHFHYLSSDILSSTIYRPAYKRTEMPLLWLTNEQCIFKQAADCLHLVNPLADELLYILLNSHRFICCIMCVFHYTVTRNLLCIFETFMQANWVNHAKRRKIGRRVAKQMLWRSQGKHWQWAARCKISLVSLSVQQALLCQSAVSTMHSETCTVVIYTLRRAL